VSRHDCCFVALDASEFLKLSEMRLSYPCTFLSLLSLAPLSVFASVLAIDYGADWIKASLMKPGIPFDVLLNKDSRRKIQSSVAWKNGDRLFGSDAFNLVRTNHVCASSSSLSFSRLRVFL
jgi:hypoxia up-regulated 1